MKAGIQYEKTGGFPLKTTTKNATDEALKDKLLHWKMGQCKGNLASNKKPALPSENR
jgi:hypothetical protein